jgi:L-ascorbate metabolism protein UlaG (beta-lactamase superfamily)
MRITYLGHASVLIELDGLKVITDPLLRPRILGALRRVAPPAAAEHLAGTDLILLSHAHHDHLDTGSLRMIEGEPPVLGPAPALRLARSVGLTGEALDVGSSSRHGAVTIEAVHADHDGRRMPWSRDAQALGFVLRGPSGSVYFAGDTGVYEEMSDLGTVDAALLPVAGWGPRLPAGHMGPGEAADAVARIEPRLAIPIHWGSYERVGMRSGGARDEPARRFCDQVGERSPGVRAVLLEPGATVEVEPEGSSA